MAAHHQSDERSQADDQTLERLADVSPSDVGHLIEFEAAAPAIAYMETGGTLPMVGRAMTVQIPPTDSVAVHEAVDRLQPGDVLVVDVQGHTEHAPWGEMTTIAARENGAVGAVIDGSLTDSRAVADQEFPVYARARSVRTTGLHGRGGKIDIPVQIGGTAVAPGDVVFGNEDGVLFLDPGTVSSLVEAASGLADREQTIETALADGSQLGELTGASDMFDAMQEEKQSADGDD